MNTPAVPKFCPNGCGETIVAKILTGQELELLQHANPKYINHWHYKCVKCDVEGYISEGMKK